MIVDRLEMARKLFENPKLRAINEFGGIVYVGHGDETDYTKNDKCLNWLHSGYVDLCIIEGETWEIIEPKLKEFCFGELQYILINKPYISYVNCKSVESGSNLAKLRAETTLEELKGKWTIEGYYEEVDNDKK